MTTRFTESIKDHISFWSFYVNASTILENFEEELGKTVEPPAQKALISTYAVLVQEMRKEAHRCGLVKLELLLASLADYLSLNAFRSDRKLDYMLLGETLDAVEEYLEEASLGKARVPIQYDRCMDSLRREVYL